MSFVSPFILFGLLAVSIPLLIHLFNFRRFRKVYFSNVRFLKDLKQQTRKQSRLRHLIIMFLRMLAIASLVFAFAQPYIPVKNMPVDPEAVNAVSIYVDNSFSMGAEGTSGNLFDQARVRASEIASAYRSSDYFQLLNNDFKGSHQRLVSQEEFGEMLTDADLSGASRKLSDIMARQQELLLASSAGGKRAYVLSDFQKSMTDLSRVKTDTSVLTWLVPLVSAGNDNIFIDSCWFVSPVHQVNQGVKLVARIRNDGSEGLEKIPVKLTINGQQKALASVDLRPGAYEDVELSFTNYQPGIQFGEVEIVDYPITYDDKFYICFEVASSINVLSINGDKPNPYLNSLFGKDSVFRFVNNYYRQIDFNRLPSDKLIILNELKDIYSGLAQELDQFLQNGGSLLIIPSAQADLESYNDFLMREGVNYYLPRTDQGTRVSDLDFEHPIFNDVFEQSFVKDARRKLPLNLPMVKSYYPISRQTRTDQVPLIRMLNGDFFMTHEKAGNGNIYLLSVPLDGAYSNFTHHALFVPVMYKLGLLSAATDPLYYTTGKANLIEISNLDVSGESVIKINQHGDDREFIPEQQNIGRKTVVKISEGQADAGLYELTLDGKLVKGLAFNYGRQESSMDKYSPDELRDQISRQGLKNVMVLDAANQPLTQTIKQMNQGVRLWKLFIILALVFLATEVALLRLWA